VAEGAPAVKLFPASLAEPAYLPALRPLLPELKLLVTGGIEPEAVRPWLDAGALAVGLGSKLGTAASVGADEVERRCRAALAAAA
jgi:2-dehydro-3-deoxyphosphogluconate aldolase / (4S)-4-hydroxy-2-oxoglutarate aldolase